jgi:hypothetical protein
MVFNVTFNMNVNVISFTYSFSYVELCLTSIIFPETNKKIVIKTNMTITLRLPHVYEIKNRIGGVMVSVLASSAVDRGFEPRSDQTEDYTIDICCFSDKHAALRRKSKDWLARNQNNVFE